MRHPLNLFLAFLLATPILPAQQPALATPSGPSVTTLKTSTNLVLVDVMVTDKNGKPVHNLSTSDFIVDENNAQQKIHDFEEHSAAPSDGTIPPMPNLPKGVFTNYSPSPVSGPLNIILLDTLNTETSDQVYLRAQIIKFLKAAHPGTRMAIFILNNTHLALLQSFTSDPELLRSAIDKKSVHNSLMLDNAQTGDKSSTAADDLQKYENPKLPPDPRLIALMNQIDAETTSLQTNMRVEYTLNAMSQLARYLSNFSGRKNLIWFSGSFPISILPPAPANATDKSIQNPFAAVTNSERKLHETTNLFSRSQVAVYPVNAQGLFNMQLSLATAPGRRSVPDESSAQVQMFGDAVEQHATMLEMAHQTGGIATINNNDFSGAVDNAISSGSNYYTLSYVPTNSNNHGEFRKIQIKLRQNGYTLAYRRGYYADDPRHTQDSPTFTHPDTVHLAMMRGAPQPTEIILKTRVRPTEPSTSPPELKLAADTQPGPKSSLVRGPYRNYSVDVGAIPRTIAFTVTADGHHYAYLECMTAAFNENGALITSTNSRALLNLNAEAYAQFLQDGFQLHQQISVPIKGNFYLRIGLHDATNDRVGAVEFPLAAVSNLPPAPLPLQERSALSKDDSVNQ